MEREIEDTPRLRTRSSVLLGGPDGGGATLAEGPEGSTVGSWSCDRSSGRLATLASDLLPESEPTPVEEPVGVSVDGREYFWAFVPGAGKWLAR